MKKLLTLCIAVALAATMTACGGTTPASSSAADESVSAADESASVADESVSAEDSASAEESASADSSEASAESTDTAASTLPELDGFTKAEQSGMTTYTGADGSAIVVQTTAADAASLEGFASKDEAVAATLNETMASVFATMMPDSEVKGEFATVEGKDVFLVNMKIAKDEAKNIPMDMEIVVYMLPGTDCFYTVSGTGLGTDITPQMGEILKAM